MIIRTINSTEAQNNFGRLLDDVVEQDTCYLIQRFGKAKAAIIPLDDFRRLVGQGSEAARRLREASAGYSLGQPQTEDTVRRLIEPGSME